MSSAMLLPTDEHGLAIATWWLVFATFSLVGTALLTIAFAWWQLAVQRRQSKIENLERLYDRFESESFRQTRRKLASMRLDRDEELVEMDAKYIPTEMQEIVDFFEHLGHLVRHRHIDSYDTWHTFATWIGPVYADVRQHIAVEQLDDETVYEDFVWLFKKMCHEDEKKKGAGLIWDDDDLAGYYLWERGPEVTIPRRKRIKRKKPVSTNTKPDVVGDSNA